jgi:hypothetical protein
VPGTTIPRKNAALHGDSVRDDFGEEFAREEDARTHAARVASELARHQSDGRH